jgi:ABC-type Fe3+ transport system permease subunit
MSGLALGHVMLAAALLAALFGLWQLSIWLRSRDYGRGTPQYAHGRDGKRYAIWSFALAFILAALCLTPLCNVALGASSQSASTKDA